MKFATTVSCLHILLAQSSQVEFTAAPWRPWWTPTPIAGLDRWADAPAAWFEGRPVVFAADPYWIRMWDLDVQASRAPIHVLS